jgi:hypothetical protein
MSSPEGMAASSRESTESLFPCPVCRKMIRVRNTKNGKPYLICDGCGVQMFIRGREGIARFKQLLGDTEVSENVRDLGALLDHYAFLKTLLRDTRNQTTVFGNIPGMETEERVLRTQLRRLEKYIRGDLRRRMAELKSE